MASTTGLLLLMFVTLVAGRPRLDVIAPRIGKNQWVALHLLGESPVPVTRVGGSSLELHFRVTKASECESTASDLNVTMPDVNGVVWDVDFGDSNTISWQTHCGGSVSAKQQGDLIAGATLAMETANCPSLSQVQQVTVYFHLAPKCRLMLRLNADLQLMLSDPPTNVVPTSLPTGFQFLPRHPNAVGDDGGDPKSPFEFAFGRQWTVSLGGTVSCFVAVDDRQPKRKMSLLTGDQRCRGMWKLQFDEDERCNLLVELESSGLTLMNSLNATVKLPLGLVVGTIQLFLVDDAVLVRLEGEPEVESLPVCPASMAATQKIAVLAVESDCTNPKLVFDSAVDLALPTKASSESAAVVSSTGPIQDLQTSTATPNTTTTGPIQILSPLTALWVGLCIGIPLLVFTLVITAYILVKRFMPSSTDEFARHVHIQTERQKAKTKKKKKSQTPLNSDA